MKQHNFDMNQMGSAPSSIASTDAMLQPDVLLPAQFFDRRPQRAIEGEIRMLVDSFHGALRDLKRSDRREIYLAALWWFRDTESESVVGLATICDLMGADVHLVSRTVLRYVNAGRVAELVPTILDCQPRDHVVDGSGRREVDWRYWQQRRKRERMLARVTAEVN